VKQRVESAESRYNGRVIPAHTSADKFIHSLLSVTIPPSKKDAMLSAWFVCLSASPLGYL